MSAYYHMDLESFAIAPKTGGRKFLRWESFMMRKFLEWESFQNEKVFKMRTFFGWEIFKCHSLFNCTGHSNRTKYMTKVRLVGENILANSSISTFKKWNVQVAATVYFKMWEEANSHKMFRTPRHPSFPTFPHCVFWNVSSKSLKIHTKYSGHLASRAYKNLGRNQMLWDAGLPLRAMDNITAVQAKVKSIIMPPNDNALNLEDDHHHHNPDL